MGHRDRGCGCPLPLHLRTLLGVGEQARSRRQHYRPRHPGRDERRRRILPPQPRERLTKTVAEEPGSRPESARGPWMSVPRPGCTATGHGIAIENSSSLLMEQLTVAGGFAIFK